MRIFLIFILLNIFNSFAQDTIKGDVDLKIYKGDKIIQREFKSSKNYIKIIYVYNSNGLLIYRRWYNKSGKLLGVSLEN
jgi:hypothetical protein